MVVACISLFVGLSGVGSAAIVLKKNSVLSKHIKNNQVQSVDVKDSSLLALDFAPGQLLQGAKGQTGERGLQGERGAQGPGAVKIIYGEAGIANAAPWVDVAAVGPWAISASCLDSGGDTFLSVGARGPGAAQWAGLTAPDDSTPTSDTGGQVLTEVTEVLVSVAAGDASFNRLAFDIQLHSASETATVSVNGLADGRGAGTGTCSLFGTAVPAS
jgi:hypothetical protein